MTTGGPTYIPHLRKWVKWEYDTTDWPFVPLLDREETEEERKLRLLTLDRVFAYGQYWLEVPMLGEDGYEAYWAEAHKNYMEDMKAAGFWDLEVKPNGDLWPIPNSLEFRIGDFPPKATLAHVMHRAKFFPSVGEAKRNGWDRPIEVGYYTVGKRKGRIRVIE